jgi:hypothetical protein
VKQQTTRIWLATLRKLQAIRKVTEDSQVRIIDRLVNKEWEKVKRLTRKENEVGIS